MHDVSAVSAPDAPSSFTPAGPLAAGWYRVRCLIDGLKVAWLSVASAVIGFVLFLNAPPAQDLFLEGKGDPYADLTFWGSFYGIVILFWALPVFISARWILASFEEGSAAPTFSRSFTVARWVRCYVPPALVMVCLAAVLAGQLMALHNSPTINDLSRAEVLAGSAQRLRETFERCGEVSQVGPVIVVCTIWSDPRGFAMTLGEYFSQGLKREYVPLAVYALGILVAFWFFFARPSKSDTFRIARFARKLIVATTAFLMVAPIAAILTMLGANALLGWDDVVLVGVGTALGVLALVVLLAWIGWDRLLWWLGTLFALPIALLVWAALIGFILIELDTAFGLAHLILLPAATAIVGILAWLGLRPHPDEQATRLGRMLLGLAGNEVPATKDAVTVALVRPIFYVSLAVSLVMILACIIIHPLIVTGYFHRALLLPILLGLPVAAVTYITYWSARWQAPLVPAVVGLVALWGIVSGTIWEDIDLVRQVKSPNPRPSLDTVVKQWEAANGCERGAEPPSEKACPAPVIIAAAGGASRSAFHVAGVLGTLLDEQRFSPLRGHDGRIRSAAFSPDGRRIVTASEDQTARIWNARTGRAIGEPLSGHTKQINQAAFSPDGSRIVTASDDQTARIWDVESGRELRKLEGHTKSVRSAAFGPDGTRVVTASDDQFARVWDAAGGTEISALKGHTSRVNSAAFSPDGAQIATAAWDRTLRVWDAQTGQSLWEVKNAHARDINGVAYNSSGTRIATVSDDGTARVWDTATRQPISELKEHTDWVLAGAFSADGTRLVTASRDRTARIWPNDPDLPVVVIRGHSQALTSAAFSPDGARVITTSEDGTARVWDARDGRRMQWDVEGRQTGAFANRLFAISAVSGGALGAAVVYAALADSQRLVRRGIEPIKPPCTEESVHDADWYASAGERVERREPSKSWRDCLQVLIAGDFLSPVFVSLLSNDLFNIDLRGSRADVLEQAWEARYARLTGVPDPNRAGSDLIFLRERPGTLAQSLTSIRRNVLERNSSSWLPVLLLNGTSVATGRRIVTSDIDTWSRDNRGAVIGGIFRDTYDLHELLDRRPDPTLKGHARGINAVAVTADGSRVVTGSADSSALVWDVKSQTQVGVLAGHSALIASVATTPDGARIVTGSDDKSARVWEPGPSQPDGTKTWRAIGALTGHTERVNEVAISSDGKRVVTGSYDDTARVWEPIQGPLGPDWQTTTLKGHTADVNGVAMTPDGSLVATASDDATARLWRQDASAGWATVATLDGRQGRLWSIAISADGNRVVTGSAEGAVKIWEPKSGSGKDAKDWHAVAELAGHTRGIKAVAITADGSRIITGSDDKTARVWERGPAAAGSTEWRAVAELSSSDPPGPDPKGHTGEVNSVAVTPDGSRILTASADTTARIWAAKPGAPAVWQPSAVLKRYLDAGPRCEECDIRLSTAVTMSARFPIVSPAGTIRDRSERIVDRVVDGGYYENFGATTAQELADALREKPYGLKPVVVLINNEPEETAMKCDEEISGPAISENTATPWFPTISSPLDALLRTRTARGTHAAVNLCAAYQRRFAHVRVKPDPTDSTKALSMSWWMSKHVQKRLDEELDDNVNAAAFDMARQIRSE